MAGRRGRPPPNRRRRPGQEAAPLENLNSNGPRDSHLNGRGQGSAASATRGDLPNPAADFQQPSLRAAHLARRHFLRPSVAKVIAAELRLGPLDGGAR